MNERCGAYLALAMGLGLLACETEDISVGSEGAGLNLARCWKADCDKLVPTQTVEAPSVGQCDLPPERELTLAWERGLCGGGCDPNRLVAARDGTVWFLGMAQQVLVLSHHALDGSLLGEVEFATTANGDALVEADLGCDERGHCYVTWYTLYARTADSELIQSAFVQEFDVLARPVAAAIPLSGVAEPLVRAGAPGRVALAGAAWNGAQRGSLAMFDAGGLLYTQNNLVTFGRLPGFGVTGLSIDGEGRTAVLAKRNRYWGGVGLAVTRFDAGGSPIWDRTFASGFENDRETTLIADDAGNLTVAGFVTLAAASKFERVALVQSLDADGELRWAYHVRGHGTIAVDAPTGRVFALGSGKFGPLAWAAAEPDVATIEEITSDGTSCRRFTYPYGSKYTYFASLLALGSHDDVYLVTERGLARFTGIDGQSPDDGSVVEPTLPANSQTPHPH